MRLAKGISTFAAVVTAAAGLVAVQASPKAVKLARLC